MVAEIEVRHGGHRTAWEWSRSRLQSSGAAFESRVGNSESYGFTVKP